MAWGGIMTDLGGDGASYLPLRLYLYSPSGREGWGSRKPSFWRCRFSEIHPAPVLLAQVLPDCTPCIGPATSCVHPTAGIPSSRKPAQPRSRPRPALGPLCFCSREPVFAILFFLPIEALSRLSKLWRKFLQQPQIAIGVAEVGILHTTEICDLADFKLTFYECITSFFYVCYNQVQPFNRSKLHI